MISTFKKFMLVSSCAFALAGYGTFAMDESNMKTSVTTRRSFKPEEREVIEKFRDFYRQHSDGSDSDIALAVHQEPLVPHAEHLLETMKQGKQDVHIQILQGEVERVLSEKTVSPNWLVDAHFRYLTLLSPMGKSERDVFNHVPHHKYLDALLEKDAYGAPVVTSLYAWAISLHKHGEYYYEREGNVPYYPEISNEIGMIIESEIAKHLPAPIIYPCLGEGIFPVDLLIGCLLDDIFLLGMPTFNVKYVHGEEETTPLGFGFHELFHYKRDPRRIALESYIRGLIADYVMKGGFASDVVQELVPLAVQKYKLMMDALKRAYGSLGSQEKMPKMGLFLMKHEVPAFTKEFFTFATSIEMIEAMYTGGVEAYANIEAWENPDDPLQTSPLTGQSDLSDDQIRDITLQRVLKDNSIYEPWEIYQKIGENNAVTYIVDEGEKKSAKEKWFLENSRFTLKKSPQFIDAIFELKSGEKKAYTYPTLHRKWKNSGASLNMLGYAGIKLDRPVLKEENPKQDREDVIKFLTDVRTNLNMTMQEFVAKAKVFFGEGACGYANIYADQIQIINDNISAVLKSTLTHESSVTSTVVTLSDTSTVVSLEGTSTSDSSSTSLDVFKG